MVASKGQWISHPIANPWQAVMNFLPIERLLVHSRFTTSLKAGINTTRTELEDKIEVIAVLKDKIFK